MSKVVVDGREYPMPESFTYRELGLVKQISGLGAAELPKAIEKGDSDLMVAMTLIAMHRAGHKADVDFLMDMQVGAITFIDDDEEAASPPD